MDDPSILANAPMPLARAWRRLRNAEEVRERHDLAYYLHEIYLKYAAAIAMARYIAGEERDHRVNAVLKGLARPSLGEWLGFLRECVRFLSAAREPDPAATALRDLLETKESRWEGAVRLWNGLRTFRTGERSARDKVSLAMLLEEIVAYRNRVFGHGAPLDAAHYRELGMLLAAAFPDILRASPFLTVRRLVAFGRAQVLESSRIECSIIAYMGLNPIRSEEPLRLPYGAPVPREGILHLAGEGGAFLPLDPFLIARDEDVYFLNEASGSPEYLSYSSGERFRPPAAGEQQARLFEKILGYGVDASKLSRIGEDCRPAAEVAEPAGDQGERRLGNYRIVREVGRGAMGAVFEAVQVSLGRRVALKVLPGTFAMDPKRVERFLREARSTSRIHHPGIVPIYEVGEAEGTHFYAMEYIDGPSLAALLAGMREKAGGGGAKGSGTWDPEWISSTARRTAELAEGLEKAHLQGLVHRDVKPSNILVDSSGRFVLVDFGLVREEEAETLTRSGEMVGTLSYMSPEAVGRRRVDARADVYGLGATLYEALTLALPFPGATEHEVQGAIMFKEPIPPRKLNPRIHRDLETIVLHALEKDPDRRYATAADLAGDLRRFLRYEPIRARPLSTVTRVVRRARRHAPALGAGAAIVLLAAALAAALLMIAGQSRKDREARYRDQVARAAVGILGGHFLYFDPSQQVFTASLLESTRGLGPIRKALGDLEEAAGLIDDRPEAHYFSARAHLIEGKDAEARKALDLALARGPDFVPAMVLNAALLEREGKSSEAEGEIRRADACAGSGWPREWLEAMREAALARWTKAAAAWGKLIDRLGAGEALFPGARVEVRLGRGVAFLRSGKHREAIRDLLVASEEGRGSIIPGLLLFRAHLGKGDFEEAERTLEEMFRDSPWQDHIAIAAVSEYRYRDQGKARRWAERIANPSLKLQARLAVAWFRDYASGGDFAVPVRIAEEWVALEPKSPAAHRDAALSWFFRGDDAKAEEHAFRAHDLDPQDSFAYWFMMRASIRRGEYDRALEEARASVRFNPYHVITWSGVARALIEMNRTEEAVDMLIEAMKRTSRGFYWPYDVFDAFFGGRAPPQFVARLEEFLKEDPDHPGLRALHAASFRARSMLREAAGEYREALRLLDDALYHELLGDILVALDSSDPGGGFLAEAIREYCAAIDRRPLHGNPHRHLWPLLRRGIPGECSEALAGSLRRLEDAWAAEKVDTPQVLHTLALGWSRLPEDRSDHAKAAAWAEKAAEIGGRIEDFLLLAEVRERGGDTKGALLSLEEALRESAADLHWREMARALRERLGGDLPGPASIDAAIEELDSVVLVPLGAEWRYWKGTAEPSPDASGSPSLAWTGAVFDDAGWPVSPAPLGYGDRTYPSAALADMRGKYGAAYFRHRFSVAGRDAVRRLLLYYEVDDGMVAFLNGKEVRRFHAGSRGQAVPSTGTAREWVTNAEPGEIGLDPGLLAEGENLFAVQGLNASPNSSDFTFAAGLRAVIPPDPKRDAEFLEKCRTLFQGPDAGERIRYLEARIHERAGRAAEAAACCSDLLQREWEPADRARILLVLCRSLRAAGNPAEAARKLSEALRQPDLRSERALWEMWLELELQGGRSPSEVLADLPGGQASSVPQDIGARALPEVTMSSASPGGYAEDAAWILERLVRGEPIRIDCGGDGDPAGGAAWARDRFYVGCPSGADFLRLGARHPNPVRGTDAERVFQSSRWFSDTIPGEPGYRLPLSPGEYDVVLGFSEAWLKEPGERVFGIEVEGRRAIEDYDGAARAGAYAADRVEIEKVRVEDGILDIRFIPMTDNPHVAAIEVRPVR